MQPNLRRNHDRNQKKYSSKTSQKNQFPAKALFFVKTKVKVEIGAHPYRRLDIDSNAATYGRKKNIIKKIKLI